MESSKIILKPGDLIEKSVKVLARNKDGRPTGGYTWKSKVGVIIRVEKKQVQSFVANTYDFAFVVIRFPGEKYDQRFLYGELLCYLRGHDRATGDKVENPWKYHPSKRNTEQTIKNRTEKGFPRLSFPENDVIIDR